MSEYNASSIQLLEEMEHLQKRMTMWVGSKSSPIHLFREVFNNSVDEHIAGFGSKIDVVRYKDGSMSVRDYGRGIPVDIHPKAGLPAVEVVFTKLYTGGKFDNDNYKVSAGLNGVGLTAVTALSDRVRVKVFRDKKMYLIEFGNGKTTRKLTSTDKNTNFHAGTLIRI